MVFKIHSSESRRKSHIKDTKNPLLPIANYYTVLLQDFTKISKNIYYELLISPYLCTNCHLQYSLDVVVLLMEENLFAGKCIW